jgi:stress response protein SCP2
VSATLVQGQSVALAVDQIVISARVAVEADLSALLLTAWGKVRLDGDLVFYNQPSGPGVRLIAGVPGGAGSLAFAFGQIPAEIKQVRVVLSLDDPRGDFGDHPPARLEIRDGNGDPICDYVIEGVSGSAVVVALDLERDGQGWLARAVGQGYPPGFAGLIAEHGVAVDHSPQSLADVAPERVEMPLNPTRPAELVRGQDVALRHGNGDLTYVKMALGWDPVRERTRWGGLRDANVDLDAAALLFAGRDLCDFAYYAKLSSNDGSVRHQGDNVTGQGAGDDEIITVDLTRVPPHVTGIVFIVTSYQGHTFERVQNAFWRLVDGTSGTELARYDLLGGGPHTGMVMARLYRRDGAWKLQAIGEAIEAGHPSEAVPQVIRFLPA